MLEHKLFLFQKEHKNYTERHTHIQTHMRTHKFMRANKSIENSRDGIHQLDIHSETMEENPHYNTKV